MNPTILVTGATGNVGREVVRSLSAEGMICRVGVRNPSKVSDSFDDDVQIVKFDFLDATTFADAFDGIRSLFLVRPPQLANVPRDITPAIEYAHEQALEHIVFLSLQGVESAKVTPHYKIETLIKDLGIDYTFLRAGFFMQNLSTTHLEEIRDERIIAVPVGNARTSFIDVRDIGAVAAKALIYPHHNNQSYTLTGSEALTYDQVAGILSDVLGHEIRYTRPNPIRFFIRMLRKGHPIGYAIVVTALYSATRAGNAEEMTADVQKILGRPPITFREFAEGYREVWLS